MQGIEIIYNTALGVMTVVSLALTVIAMLAYKRSRNSKILAITSAFSLFLIKGLWLSYQSFNEPMVNESDLLIPVLIIDTIILILFYISAFKR